MQFFQKFPFTNYTLTEFVNGLPYVVTRYVPNMTTKLTLLSVGDERYAYTYYRVRDTDRPDTVAAQFYGSAKYTWVVLMANDIRDWYDWPLTDLEFEHYMNGQYETQTGLFDGSAAARATVENYQQIVQSVDGVEERVNVDSTAYALLLPAARTTVTVYDAEKADNDAKRLIRLPTPDSLSIIEGQLNRALQGVSN